MESDVDWQVRKEAYEKIMQMMENPDPQFTMDIQDQLPKYLSDDNPTCQRLALNICDLLFKNCITIDYTKFAPVLISNCLERNPNNTDLAVPLVLTCLKYSREYVMDMLFDDLLQKPPEFIKSIISVIISHLATLTVKDNEEVDEIIERLQLLKSYNDPEIVKECQAAIGSAKAVSGDFDSIEPLQSPRSSANNFNLSRTLKSDTKTEWEILLESDNWKDRKQGYELLTELINPDFSLPFYENKILTAIGDEKNVACNESAVQLIEKIATNFGSLIGRHLREYAAPILGMMKEKRQSRFGGLQQAFDALADNTPGSPFEGAFGDILVKMMASPSFRHREEAIAFILRKGGLPASGSLRESLQKLTEDPAVSIRELAGRALGTNITSQDSPSKDVTFSSQPSATSSVSLVKGSNLLRKSIKRTAISIWTAWVRPEVLAALTSTAWMQVTNGLSLLKSQYEEDSSCAPAIVAGLCSIFQPKTFPPKVMGQINEALLVYIKSASEGGRLDNDVSTAVLQYGLEKIPDKRQESGVFDILDSVSDVLGSRHVFSFFYAQLGAKNPAVPQRIVIYFGHHLQAKGVGDIDLEEFGQEMKIVFGHSDGGVRKAAQDCLSILITINPDAGKYFDYVRGFGATPASKIKEDPVQEKDSNKDNKNSNKDDKNSNKDDKNSNKDDKEKKPRGSGIPVPRRGASPKRPGRPKTSPEIKSPRLQADYAGMFRGALGAIAKATTQFECRKSLEEAKNALEKQLEHTGKQSMHIAEFAEFFDRLRPWFKDSNAAVVLSVAHTIGLSLDLIKASELPDVSNEFLTEMVLLLNFPQKAVRQQTRQNMAVVFNACSEFIPEVFIPAFSRLNNDGKMSALRFLRDVEFEIDTSFAPLIVSCIDKSEKLREFARPLILRFLSIPGGYSALEREAEQFPPAKKNGIITCIAQYGPVTEVLPKFFITNPSLERRKERESKIDPLIVLKVTNNSENLTTLQNILDEYVKEYFEPNITAPNFLEFDFNSLWSVLDIVSLFISAQILSSPETFKETSSILESILQTVFENGKNLPKLEMSILLPVILQSSGKKLDGSKSLEGFLFKVCDDNPLAELLSQIAEKSTSEFVLIGTFRALKSVLPNVNKELYSGSLKKSIWRAKDSFSESKELNEAAEELSSMLVGSVSPPKQPPSQPRSPLAASPPKKLRQKELPPTSKCSLNDAVSRGWSAPRIQVYQWIADLASEEHSVVVRGLKALTGQMKADESVLRPHTEGVVVGLLVNLHRHFGVSNPPERVCKYVSVCLLTLLSETSLSSLIAKEYVQQLIYELLTHLSNGAVEEVISQLLNAALVRLIMDRPMFSFMGLLAAVGECDNEQSPIVFNEKWFRLATKCLEACGARICEVGNPADLCNSLVLIDQFFEMHDRSRVESDALGDGAVAALKSFVEVVVGQYRDVVVTSENLTRLGPRSTVLSLAGPISIPSANGTPRQTPVLIQPPSRGRGSSR